MNLMGAHVLQAEPVRRAVKILAELRNRMDVGLLCRRRQIVDCHVLDHATTQRAHLGHLKLLSESGLHTQSSQPGGQLRYMRRDRRFRPAAIAASFNRCSAASPTDAR
jgi:hypothetical protein